jgi:5'-3' exonuclease
MLSLAREPDVTHVAAAFDTVIRSFRNDLYPGYKTDEGVPAELLAQFPMAERALRAIGFVVWPMIEFEADDALATGAARWSPDVEQVVLCTPDKDLAQCVRTDRVVLRDRRRSLTYDAQGVKAKYGVEPRSIPDWLALVGDSADGFPGLPGWGEKSAAAVLSRWIRLDDIPDDVARWEVKVRGADRLAATLRERRDEALLYRTLATLRTDAPLAESLADLEWRGVPRAEYLALCDELGLGGDATTRPQRWR